MLYDVLSMDCLFLVFPLNVLYNFFLQVKQRKQFGECQERILKRRPPLHPNIADCNEENCVLKDPSNSCDVFSKEFLFVFVSIVEEFFYSDYRPQSQCMSGQLNI